MDEYWDGVRQRWLSFEAGVDSPPANRPSDQIRIKPMLPLSLYRPTLPLVVTGLRGAGKSVLYDSILGKVGNSYVPEGQSFDVVMVKGSGSPVPRLSRPTICIRPPLLPTLISLLLRPKPALPPVRIRKGQERGRARRAEEVIFERPRVTRTGIRLCRRLATRPRKRLASE